MSKWEQAKAICKYTSTMSEELLSRDKLLDDKDADILVIAKVWDEYDKLLTENNATDFSTIQADAWRMMQDSDISASVREKIRYVMVDEYQDTNHIQEQLILAIGGNSEISAWSVTMTRGCTASEGRLYGTFSNSRSISEKTNAG